MISCISYVFSGLLFGEIHHFDDPQFKILSNLIKKTFVEIKQNVIARVIVNLLPEFMIRSPSCRKIINYLLPTFERMGDNVYKEFYPFLIQKIKEHQGRSHNGGPWHLWISRILLPVSELFENCLLRSPEKKVLSSNERKGCTTCVYVRKQ